MRLERYSQRGGFEVPCVEGLLMVMYQALTPERMGRRRSARTLRSHVGLQVVIMPVKVE